MSRQDKATTDRNAKILRELVKHPDNKQCADCRRNDARWASWNLGCFMCIRCSGIHRSMGTHISKVKSVDLDIWTPEQMDNIQRWGNKLANLYWEAHLKPGHIPPEHKIESFIRSKYESRRWAMSSPVPSDPQVLLYTEHAPDSTAPPAPPAEIQPQVRAPPTSVRSNIAHPLLSRQAPVAASTAAASPSLAPAPKPTPTSAPILAPALAPVQQPAAPAPAPAPAASDSLFDLDFHAPATTTSSSFGGGANKSAGQKKSGIEDIMSLFSAPPSAGPATLPTHSGNGWQQSQQTAATAGTGGLSSGFGGLSLGGGGQDVWGQPASRPVPLQQQQQQPPRQSNSGSAWGDFQSHGTSTGAASSSIWDAVPAPASSSQDIWASSSAKPSAAAPKDDLFADIWK